MITTKCFWQVSVTGFAGMLLELTSPSVWMS
jgi:hypothetical protein